MAELTPIEWADATWNPFSGCEKVSAGCKNCYMFRDKARYGQNPNEVTRSKTTFYAPLKWLTPQFVFTCSWSDFFIEQADEWREEAYGVMRKTPHTYLVLTKRIGRACNLVLLPDPPIRNMWLGVSIENQKTKDRLWWLSEARAAAKITRTFLSIEPLLEDLGQLDLRGIDWVMVGGESGPGARPMHPDWARSIRDQCVASGVAFHFKQWGDWAPISKEFSYYDYGCMVRNNSDFVRQLRRYAKDTHASELLCADSLAEGRKSGCILYGEPALGRVGKKAAGRLLDGRTWDERPPLEIIAAQSGVER